MLTEVDISYNLIVQSLNPTYSTLTELHLLNHIVGLHIYDDACIEFHHTKLVITIYYAHKASCGCHLLKKQVQKHSCEFMRSRTARTGFSMKRGDVDLTCLLSSYKFIFSWNRFSQGIAPSHCPILLPANQNKIQSKRKS